VRTETSISINAPSERIWAVLIDVERWPEWTATMASVQRLDDGELRVGSRARIRQPKLPVVVWQVSDVQPGRSFTWRAGNPLSKAVAGHEIEPEGAGCKVTIWIEQAGLLQPLLGLLYASLTRRYIRTEVEGLKARCEAG
jgi:uncharacterized membrane protein